VPVLRRVGAGGPPNSDRGLREAGQAADRLPRPRVIGADSDEALRAAIAAGQDDHLWDIVHGLYEKQGAENAGWVTDELVTAIAAGVPGLDAERLLETRWEQGVEDEMERAAVAAQATGVSGKPAFQLGATGGRLRLLEVTSLGPEGIVPAIEDRLAG
jgi:predicted DsbA family dithiol-disulfide isomerase